MAAGCSDLYNLFTGNQLARATVFALGIMPYISASIFQQIAQAVVPQVDKMSKDEEGRKKINQWSRYATVVLAAVQAWGFAIFAESLPGAVTNPGFGFRLSMTFFLTTGAIFVMWLGEQITERGIGNGASLMIFFSIVERIWPGIGVGVHVHLDRRHRDLLAARADRDDGAVVAGDRRGDDGGAASADSDPAAHDAARPHARGDRRASSRSASMPRASCRSSSRSR